MSYQTRLTDDDVRDVSAAVRSAIRFGSPQINSGLVVDALTRSGEEPDLVAVLETLYMVDSAAQLDRMPAHLVSAFEEIHANLPYRST